MGNRLFQMGCFLAVGFALTLQAYNAAPYPSDKITYLKGNSTALGTEQGKLLRKEITELRDGWLNPVVKTIPGISSWFIHSKVSHMEPFVSEDQVAEMQALATELGLPYREMVLASAIPDVLELINKPFGCSTLVVSPTRSKNKGMIYGRNLDYKRSDLLRQYWKPVVFEKTGKNKILSLHLPGMVGVVTAINDKRVMMSRLTSYSSDKTSKGMPSLLLFRKVLEEATTAREAIQLYLKAPRTVAINIMISDGKEAFVLEVSQNLSVVREVNSSGVLYAANHYVDPAMKGTHKPDKRWPVLSRYDKTRDLLTPDNVLETMKLSGQEGQNILVALFDYSSQKLVFGSDPETKGISALGKLYELDLPTVFGE